MKNALTYNELMALKVSAKPLDAFGPGTDFEYLIFELDGSDDAISLSLIHI